MLKFPALSNPKMKKKSNLKKFLVSARLAFFLAYRQIKRSSLGTTALIIFVMTLTFLNLVVVSGILVGLVQGATEAVKNQYISDVAVTPLSGKKNIQESPSIIQATKSLPWVSAVTARYISGGDIEANYQTKIKQSDKTDKVSTVMSGINPIDEDKVTGLSKYIVEGSYLSSDDNDKIIIGSLLLKKYFPMESRGFETLSNVGVGSKVRVTLNGITREVTIKGILKSKVDDIGRRVFFIDSEFRKLVGRNDYSVDEIAIKIKPGTDPTLTRNALIGDGFNQYAKIQTFDEGKPKFLTDLVNTFTLLGAVVGGIGLVVASITIFIVIFINAITRRKFIGILKGIGIDSTAIEISYVMQSLFYALTGTAIGLALLFFFLKPYFDAHPINFPFSDGILVATYSGTAVRVLILFVATVIAGFIPARIVVKQNTLDAILGR